MNQKERLLRPTQNPRRLSAFWSALCLATMLCVGQAQASPFQEVKPNEDLYQRVKALGQWGLLDTQDQAVLDRGETVTRLQLAFYTEKAKTRISAPIRATDTPVATVEPAVVAPAQQAMPELVAPSAQQPAVEPTVAPAVPALAAPATPEAQPTAVIASPAISKEIDDLLKAMKNESTYLKARQPLLDNDIKLQETELKDIKRIQSDADGVARKANKNSGDWSFNTNASWNFEDFTLNGDKSKAVVATATGPVTLNPIAAQRITKMSQGIYFGMWGSLGKGSLSTGFGGTMPSSNDSSGPISVYLGKPEFKMTLDGRFGTWAFFAMDEGFQGQTTMGNFTRSVAPNRPKRYDSPFNIKCWSPDKFDKNWDEYIRSLGFVETQSLLGGLGQSTADRVFDGIVVDASDLPKLGPTKLKLLAGRMLRPTWFEYGVMLQRPWMNDRFTTKAAAYFVDDTTHIPGAASIDLRNYTGELTVNLKPLPMVVSGEFASSSFYTSVDNQLAPGQGPRPLMGQALQLQASSYPFNFYWTDIRPTYSNFQSKVNMTGIDFTRYGIAAADTDELTNKYGEIGEADLMQNNRKGWRANFGWNGRRDEWMKKDLPKFMDYFVLNVDFASRREYEATRATETSGQYLIEPWNFVTPYYPEDEGIWGLELYGGYAGSPKPTRDTIDRNITAVRQAQDPSGFVWNSSYEWVRYRFQMTTERIPLLDPATGAALSHIKTYKYFALSNKWQLNQFYGSAKPLYLGVYFADNIVSGEATDPTQTDISKMFRQQVFDATLMAGRLLPYVQLSAHFANEKWTSDCTIPRIKYNTNSTGAGLDYNVPWGSAKIGIRYNHVVFTSDYVPANNYVAEQVWAQGNFRF
jgi:hypothetical protein